MSVTEDNTSFWIVKYYGVRLDGNAYQMHIAYQMHTVYVLANTCEEAIQMIRELHDSVAKIESARKAWLIEKEDEDHR